MRVVRNDALIKKRMQFTQRGSLIGMGLLLVSLFLAGKNPALSWLFLLVGFVVAMTAVRVGNRFVRPPRADLVLDKVLKALDNKYVLYHYFHPAEHLLLTPGGLIGIRMQEQRGQIVVRQGRWRQRSVLQRLRILLGEVGLGNPSNRLRHELTEMGKMLASLQPEDSTLPLDGVIVFYSGKARLDAQDPEFPVVLPEDLKVTVRAIAEAHSTLPGRSQRALAAALAGEELAEEVTSDQESDPGNEARPAKRARSRKRKKGSGS